MSWIIIHHSGAFTNLGIQFIFKLEGNIVQRKNRNKINLQSSQKFHPVPWCAANSPTDPAQATTWVSASGGKHKLMSKGNFKGEWGEHLQSLSPIVAMNAAFRPFGHFSYLSANKIQHIHVKNTGTKALQTTLSSMLIISHSICCLAQR